MIEFAAAFIFDIFIHLFSRIIKVFQFSKKQQQKKVAHYYYGVFPNKEVKERAFTISSE